jgi:hypothetical protein
MKFMNEWDIENAVARWSGHKVLGPAARQMEILRDYANANSDGWPYWVAAEKSAARLVELIERDGTAQWTHALNAERTDATLPELRKALTEVKKFRTRVTKKGLPWFEVVDA